MGRLHRIGNATLRVYANDHLPPHFHIVTPDAEALIEIETLRILAGVLPGQVERRMLDWARQNVGDIRHEWNRINPRFPIA